MRYIYYILIIVLGLSAIIAYELREKPQSKRDAALIINERVITTEEFNSLYARSHDMAPKSEFINDLIIKELLLQEAQKTGIDREESFRKSIQNFYEQSLIKILVDRKFSSLKAALSEKELNRHLALLERKMHLTLFSYGTEEEAKRGQYRDGETKTVYLDDLSLNLREKIMLLSEGEVTEPVKAGESYLIARLDKVEAVPSRTIPETEKEKIKEMLVEEKKEKMINDWVADLKSKATIEILVGGQ
ncbi:MAG: hypothetical protein AB1442_12585 [Nitrospirota bacterium]